MDENNYFVLNICVILTTNSTLKIQTVSKKSDIVTNATLPIGKVVHSNLAYAIIYKLYDVSYTIRSSYSVPKP